MPKVSSAMDDMEYEAEEGARMLDVCRMSGSSVPFGCTIGQCGTCLTKVLAGKENLSKMESQEKQTLEMFGALDDEHRLMCQCKLHGDVELDIP